MRIIDLETMQECEINGNTVVALGTFDGCHLGHVSVFRSAYLTAKRLGIKSLVYTFDVVPKSIYDKSVKSILTLNEKIKFIRGCGIDYVAIDCFSEVQSLTGEDFVKNILLSKLHASNVVCGYNYRFGRNALCDGESLREMLQNVSGSVEICQQVSVNNIPVSSTLIREKIQNGEVEDILSLSPPYSIYAQVIEGKKLGRTIGIPTINQLVPNEKITPKRGVYITECEIGEDVYPAITNVGIHPTVDSDVGENLETYIIGYSGDLYYSYVRVNFYKRLRDEIKFDSLNLLKLQIEKDIEKSVEYFK